jgi:hypothetical protein
MAQEDKMRYERDMAKYQGRWTSGPSKNIEIKKIMKSINFNMKISLLLCIRQPIII